MARGAHTARKTPGVMGLAAASLLLLCAGTAGAQGDASSGGSPAERRHGLDLSLDVDRILPRFGPAAAARPRSGLSPAASLPDPRALKGSGSRGEEARLRLNLKGFSLLEAREGEGTEFRVRRIREREWRRPVLSVTLQKRF